MKPSFPTFFAEKKVCEKVLNQRQMKAPLFFMDALSKAQESSHSI